MFKPLKRAILLTAILAMTGSCSGVKFQSNSSEGTASKDCDVNTCPPPNNSYFWKEGGFGLCSKPCGGGTQTQSVDCRRTSDNAVVPDSNCTGSKPDAVKSCNISACTTTYTWNIGTYGTCSKTCGSGIMTRTVVCQDANGSTVADSLCPQPKPQTSDLCNTMACPPVSYAWEVTPGPCSVQCGGGIANDTVVCKRNDGTVVADSFCASTTKPPTQRVCNTHTCPVVYTYAWEPGTWSKCSAACGPGIETRSVACLRNDGVYVIESYCDANTKPITQQSCNLGKCPVGNPVTQTATVPPASNSVDVILMVDDSNSMANDQAKLASRLINFVTDLDALNIDYQICLTTTDISYYKGAPIKWQGTNSVILNRSTPDKDTVFRNTVASLGAEWSSDEQGIKSTYTMIRDFGPNSGAANSGCFRSQSTLTVIEVSDEDERSVGGNASLSSAQYKPLTSENYPDTLINFVHSTFDSGTFKKPFIWNSIIVKPGDKSCESAQDAEGSPSFPGVLLAELSSKTGGQVASICEADYANNMKLIKNKIVNSMPGLQLQCVPIDTPVVTFNPAFTTTVTLSGSMLKFSPALPEGMQITVKYTCP